MQIRTFQCDACGKGSEPSQWPVNVPQGWLCIGLTLDLKGRTETPRGVSVTASGHACCDDHAAAVAHVLAMQALKDVK